MNDRKRSQAHIVLTAAVLLLSASFYVHQSLINGTFLQIREHISVRFIYFAFAMLFVHWIKCTRIYLLTIDTRLKYMANIKQYTKTTLVNITLPFKIGELFRIYSYGYAIGDYVTGTAIVLIDRFIDMAALLTYMTLFLLLGFGSMLTIYVALMVCFAVMAVVYLWFPSLYAFWNDYLLSKRQSRRSLSMLTLLAQINRARSYIQTLLIGKTFILYLASLAAWGAELLGVRLLLTDAGEANAGFGAYLTSALNGSPNPHQPVCVFISILILTPIMVIAYAICWRRKHAANPIDL